MKTTALAMAITDSELSDEEASILESGGFSVSRATTPQLTDLSEGKSERPPPRGASGCPEVGRLHLSVADLDQQSLHGDPPEEAFLRDLPEFPPAEEPLSPASLLIQHLASPLHFVNSHFNGHVRAPGAEEGAPGAAVTQGAQRSLEALSEEIVSTAISTVVQNTLSALLRAGEEPPPAGAPPDPLEAAGAPDPDRDLEGGVATESSAGEEFPDDTLVPTEEEDFEVLDQSELEQAGGGLEPGSDGEVGGPPAPDTATSLQPQSS